jgi:hypothetical protein
MNNESIFIKCPHCNEFIEVKVCEFNCRIFRHGVYKDSFKQIDPHLDKLNCERLIRENLIYGCGKPFQLIVEENGYKTVICDYI